MMLSFSAPSFFERGTPFISVLLVTPATTMFPCSSNKTIAGLVLTSKVSTNCILARTTSPNLCIFPGLIFLVVPQLLHFRLLDLVKKLVVLVPFARSQEEKHYLFHKLVVCLPRVEKA